MTKNYWYALKTIFFSSLLLYGCNSTRHIKAGEWLVVENIVEIDSKMPTNEADALSYELGRVAKQKPNRTFLGQRTRMKTYFWTQRRLAKNNFQDTTKVQKFLLGKAAELPVIYDSTLTKSSCETMQFYLNNKGYFDAVVTSNVFLGKNRTLKVAYCVETGELLTIRQVVFQSSDTAIQAALDDVRQNTLLQYGKPLSKTLFGNEKNRIVQTLQDKGFAYFYPNYIFFEGDTTQAYLKTDVKITLAPPNDSTTHRRYRIGDVFIYTQYDPANFRPKATFDTLSVSGYEGFYLIKPKDVEKYWVKPEPILNAFTFRKGELYSVTTYEESRRNLAAISAYRFVRIKSVINENNPQQLDLYIYMNPAKKMDFGVNAELNYITTNSVNAFNNLGIFGNLNFRHKNFFNKSAIFSTNATGGVELNLDQELNGAKLFNAVDIRLQTDLISPVIRTTNLFNGSQSRFSVGYNYVSREFFSVREFFSSRTNLFTLSAGYDWRQKQVTHSFNPAFVNFILPEIEEGFLLTIENNPLLLRSFDPQFIVGTNYTYRYQSPVNTARESYNLFVTAEIAGNSFNLLDRSINPDENFVFFNNSVSYAQYGRLEIDGNYTKRFKGDGSVAFRLNVGVGKAYGNSEDIPFVKQFFSGGNAGIRAWRIRDIGPGSYKRPEVLEVATPFQGGDIKLEFNAEYRFMALKSWGMEGAFFIDAGNVWLFEDKENIGRNFQFSSFLDQIAIGSGFGLRKDFSFFIFRLDLGYKIRTPYASDMNLIGTHYFLRGTWFSPNWVIAIGYPF